MFDIYPEEIKKEIPFEEVVVEPDIRVKTELFENEEELDENFNCDTADDELHHSELMRDENINESIDQINYKNISSYSENYKLFPNLNILMQSDSQRSFPRNSVRCRTRGNPYINPQLKKQFMLRSFQCKKCPRYFKTPGYLKAHCAKVHNVN
ncbi:hypothetical protein HHI36_005519 [Cryptolaemus montrouzieri]|uniref:C2H2-type domain-containing protein n=1 Tax=Cryptolaemus montrouzieri TaxID=559131 RepID=A0ABD2NUW7_9CUCU